MDIREWLRTVEVVPSPEVPGISSIFRSNGVEALPKHHRKRTRSSSDSSLLKPEPALKHKSSRLDRRSIGASDHSSTASARTSSQHSTSVPEVRVEHFGRRPRHKTRENLYEPYAGERRRRSRREHRHGKSGEHKTKRASKHEGKKKSRSSAKMINNFHATNVRKDRLSLPPTTLGLFKKGRASSPVRGRGLPDLVFSEMRFLQKPNMHAPLERSGSGSANTGKKDRVKAREEEMSAYFTSKRPPVEEKSHHSKSLSIQAGEINTSIINNHFQRKDLLVPAEPAHNSVQATPVVELPPKPFLGFGSSGSHPYRPVRNHPQSHSGAKSYLSWSESVGPPRCGPFLDAATAVDVGQLADIPTQREPPETEGVDHQLPRQPELDVYAAAPVRSPQSAENGKLLSKTECETALLDTNHSSPVSGIVQGRVCDENVSIQKRAVDTRSSSPLKSLLRACGEALNQELHAPSRFEPQATTTNSWYQPHMDSQLVMQQRARDIGSANHRHFKGSAAETHCTARKTPSSRCAGQTYQGHNDNREYFSSIASGNNRLVEAEEPLLHGFEHPKANLVSSPNVVKATRQFMRQGSRDPSAMSYAVGRYDIHSLPRSRIVAGADLSNNALDDGHYAYDDDADSIGALDISPERECFMSERPHEYFPETGGVAYGLDEDIDEQHLAPVGFWRPDRLY